MAGQVRDAGGEILALGGRILDVHGTPIANSVVEIWQVDANGRYLHTADARRGGGDPAFQGFGRVRADEQGRYAFRTIRPVPYSGRTPHIHFKIYRPNGRVLTTQLAIAGEPENDRDGLLRRLSPQERGLVTAEFRRIGRDWAATWDVVLP
jgi:protocatechuate 3,4-dioxygenase beta subunit